MNRKSELLPNQYIPSAILEDEEDWLNDSPEQIAKEDALWKAVFARNPDLMQKMANEAIAEYRSKRARRNTRKDSQAKV